MTAQKHDIPDHLIPSEDVVLAASDEEIELNKQLDTPKWVYTEEPDDSRCPYCGKEYVDTTDAGQVRSKGVCPYPVEEHGDFIVRVVHQKSPRKPVAWDDNGNVTMWSGGSIERFCGPEHEETLVTYPCLKDWDLSNI